MRANIVLSVVLAVLVAGSVWAGTNLVMGNKPPGFNDSITRGILTLRGNSPPPSLKQNERGVISFQDASFCPVDEEIGIDVAFEVAEREQIRASYSDREEGDILRHQTGDWICNMTIRGDIWYDEPITCWNTQTKAAAAVAPQRGDGINVIDADFRGFQVCLDRLRRSNNAEAGDADG